MGVCDGKTSHICHARTNINNKNTTTPRARREPTIRTTNKQKQQKEKTNKSEGAKENKKEEGKTMTVLKLLGSASYRSFRCLWMLEELGIEYQHLPIGPQSEEARKVNPLGKIPILIEEEGGEGGENNGNLFTVYESSAIVTYLGDKFRSTKTTTTTSSATTVDSSTLVPVAGTRNRAIYDQTMSVLTSELDSQGLWIHHKHETLGEIFSYAPEAVRHARKYFHKTNRVLIQQLKDSDGSYLLGSNFTAVDIFYIHCLDWSKAIGWDDKWKTEPSMLEYIELCKQRPAYHRVKEIKRAEDGGESKY